MPVMIVLTVLINPFMAQVANADPTGVPSDTAAGVFGEGTSAFGGGSGEAFRPDSKTGAMTWSYPFSLPAARGGPQPSLALSYNSSSHDREAGYGWGLDLPVIERKPLSGNPCFTQGGQPIACGDQHQDGSPGLVTEERYTYSGQPLVYICTLSGSPQVDGTNCGGEAQPDWPAVNGWPAGWRYFRVQVEGQFVRLYLAPDRRYWRVQLKGGELLEFGEPPSSGMLGVEHAVDNKRAILRWRLVRHSDAVHTLAGEPVNYVVYRWKPLGKRGLLYLTDVFDTPRANGPSGDLDFAHHTQLTWQSPDFPQTFYADPYHATPDLRLSRVAVASMPWSGQGPREVIRTYILGYQTAQGTTTPVLLSPAFQLWHHSFLSAITMEGRCKQLEDDQGNIAVNHECPDRLPPTTFEYEDGDPEFGIANVTQVQGGPPNAVEDNRVLPYLNSVGVVDFNRDGLPDIVQGWKPQLPCNDPECQNARPMIGYVNRGVAPSAPLKLDYQCFDAGRMTDTTGLTHYAINTRDGFFTNTGGATLVGPWGEGVLAWSNALYAPYRAKPLLPDYDLNVISLNNAAALPPVGKGLVIAAKIDGGYTVRVFDWAGNKVVDQAKNEFLPSDALFQQLDASLDNAAIDKPTKDALVRDILTTLGDALPSEPGTGCDVDQFVQSEFHPGWKWEQTQTADWAKLPVIAPDPRQHVAPRWFADVNGDGLVDQLTSTGEPVSDFETAYVDFTQRYGKNDTLPAVPGAGPAQVPFVFDPNQLPHSLAPSVAGSRNGTRYFYADINGDGLVDLVTQNPNEGGGIPRVRPGNGYGEFACIDSQQPWPCQELPTEVARIYEINAQGSRMPWPFTDETFFHDVTGDGLADIVQYDMASGEVRLWVNQDGHTFACANPATGSCVAGKILSAHAATHGLVGAAAWNIGEHRTTFADMNGDGVDDIVILAKEGAYVGTFMTKYNSAGFEHGAAPRPGLLIRIHNGYGATTDIQYQTIQQLDLKASAGPYPWQYHSPVVQDVVTQIITQDSYHAGGDSNAVPISAPYQFKRMARYLYQDPAYDRWSMSFVGFRKVVELDGDEQATTTTTYWFGPCQNNRLGARLPGAEEIPLCPNGSDDDNYKALTGRVVRIDRGNAYLDGFPIELGLLTHELPHAQGPKLLWTKIFHYSLNSNLFDRADPDRRVSFSYPSQIDTYLYDDTQPTQPGGRTSVLAAAPGVQILPAAGSDMLEDAPHQQGIRKHVSRQVEYDNWGTLKRATDSGAIVDGDSKPGDVADATTVTLYSPNNLLDPDGPSGPDDTPALLPCTSDWQCLPDYVSVWEPQPVLGGANPATLLRKSRFTYTAAGDLASVQGWLADDAAPLQRHNAAGGSTAPDPAGQALAKGWHTSTTLNYDPWGNVIQTASTQSPGGSPAACTAVGYDKAYEQLPNLVRNLKDGCDGTALETQSVFDRGFEQVASSIAPNAGASEIHYDAFGRPIEFYLPNPDALAGTQKPVLAATIAYSDRNPLSSVDVRHVVGPATSTRSVTIFNGLGEPVVAFDQGDNNDWVLNGWTETNLAGLVAKARRPWAFTGDPIATAATAKPIPIPPDNSLFEIRYDGFGRKVSTQEIGASFSQELLRTGYFPLAVETRDAEQLKLGGAHDQAFQRVEFDGYGRTTKTLQHIANPTGDDIVTTVRYNPTGEPITVNRTDATSTYQRTLEYDSLGRLMANKEPNTGNNWRYVWDDAGRLVGTSDARGCGENFYYDGLYRLTGEDYSPCLATQAAYTAPDLATGEGLEVSYRYDTYEAGQVSPDLTFTDDPRFAVGNLVAVSDRGSHTRFNYDARNRVRQISRQIAKPEGLAAGSPYAPHWFTSRLDYDLGDRLTRRTTGVDLPELMMNGGSEERYTYSAGGLPYSIDSSYGHVVEKALYGPDGAPNSITYGDYYGTRATFQYDARRRLTRYDLTNTKSYPPLWLAPLTYLDYRYSAYDEVGNPLVIEDASNGVISSITPAQLPPEAAPVQKRTMAYDDLYRLTRVDSTYKVPGGTAPWVSPFANEISTVDRHPVPLRTLPTRVTQQTFNYDGLGNLTASSDDLSARYDRSLGTNLGYGAPQNGPNQLQSGQGLQVRYDEAGNLTELKLERAGTCPTGASSQCAQWFAYDWDEVGQLARARRWDFDGNTLPPQAVPDALPADKPTWDLAYAYSQGVRVRKSVTDAAGGVGHTLEVFDTLRVEQAPFNPVSGDYQERRYEVHAYLGGIADVFYDLDGQLLHQAPGSLITMHLVLKDPLGSSSVVINHANSALVERTTYQPYGAVESDYRPAAWNAFREPYKFTGKEEDIEVGATYFGARYYQPYLGRFMSADPLTVQGLASDLNPYAYVGGRVMSRVDPLGLCTPGSVVTDPNGTTTTVTDCPPEANATEKAGRGDALASQADTQQPTVIPGETTPSVNPSGPPSDFWTSAGDLAKSKGMVLTGERIGRKVAESAAKRAFTKAGEDLASKAALKFVARAASFGAKTGGIVGLAADFATSPGGDTTLPAPVYQAVTTNELVVPGAGWHTNEADAENEARAYTSATGISTQVDKSSTKNIGGLQSTGKSDPALAAKAAAKAAEPGRQLERRGMWWYDSITGEQIGWDPLWFLH